MNEQTRIKHQAPLILRVARWLDRHGWRGGTAMQRFANRRGWLTRVIRYDLGGRGITVDVPMAHRPMDETDVRDYESTLVEQLATVIAAIGAPVRLYDCGADFGLISLKLLTRCPTITSVVAIEPNAAMYPTLAANLARLDRHAEALLGAVGDAVGHGSLCFPQHDPRSEVARFVEPDPMGSVSITTIDELAGADGPGCVVLKCDVEGAEAAVLRGAENTLRRAAHFVVAFEAHPDHVARTGFDPVAVVRALRSIRPCSAIVAETGAEVADTEIPFFEQLGERRIVNIICVST